MKTDEKIKPFASNFTTTFTKGICKGEKFSSMVNDKGEHFFQSDKRPGKFKHVFVPLDFDHPEMIPPIE